MFAEASYILYMPAYNDNNNIQSTGEIYSPNMLALPQATIV